MRPFVWLCVMVSCLTVAGFRGASAQAPTKQDSLDAALGGTGLGADLQPLPGFMTPEAAPTARPTPGLHVWSGTDLEAARQQTATIERWFGQEEQWELGQHQKLQGKLIHNEGYGDFELTIGVNFPLILDYGGEIPPTVSDDLFAALPALKAARNWTPSMRAQARSWVDRHRYAFGEAPLIGLAQSVSWEVVGLEPGKTVKLYTVVAKASAPPAQKTHAQLGEYVSFGVDDGVDQDGELRLTTSARATYVFHNVPEEFADVLGASAPGDYLVAAAAPVRRLDYHAFGDSFEGPFGLPNSRINVVVDPSKVQRLWVLGPVGGSLGHGGGDGLGAFRPKPKPRPKPTR